MNNLGFSNDNLFIGDVRVKGQDETIIIGNENGGNGYILPTEKGSEGQVLTMNADNSTSFQDAAGGGDNVLGVGNGADITIPYAPSSAPVANIIPPSFIGTRRVNIKDIAVGGSVHFYVNSRYNLQIPSAGSTDTFTNILFFVTGFRADNTSVGVAAPTIRNNNYFSGPVSVPADLVGYLKVEGVITRTATDTFKATVIAFNRRYADSLNPCQIWENVAGIEEINFPAPQDDDYIQWQLQFFNSYYTTGTFVLTNPSVYWTLKNVSDAITPSVSTSDHTQLSNLNLGDAGHTQFALLQGRSGGQVLSGGITPANFLTLKSHTAGLNNIIIKDLNTTFEKNLQIGTNQILDTLNNSIDFIGGDMNLLNTSLTNRIVIASQNNIDILANNQIKLQVPNVSGNNVVITSTDTSLNQTLNMNTNDITNANVIVRASNGNVIELDNDINPPLVTGALTIDSGAGKELRVASGAGLSVNSTSGTSYDTGSGSHLFRNTPDGTILSLSSQINASKSLNMNGNIITNTPSVSSSSSLQLKGLTVDEITINPNPSTGVSVFSDTGKSINLVADGGNQSMILDGTFITFSQGGGSFVPAFTPSAFDMNNGNINNVDTINNTGSANINIPVVIGTPSGALQVQNGGAYIKQDLQVDGSIYCDSINNIRPSGGLYSESSGFNIPSTNLTETNLLGQGGSAGTLAIPANTFSQFDSYSFKASGVLSGGSNDTATLRLKSLVNGTTPVELGSIVIQLTDNGLVDVAWKVEADFNVRTLGGAGVGVLVLSGNFAYTNNNDVLKTYLRTIVNNTVFDTTQSNELQFTYENDAVNPLTNIRIDQASFTKWY